MLCLYFLKNTTELSELNMSNDSEESKEYVAKVFEK